MAVSNKSKCRFACAVVNCVNCSRKLKQDGITNVSFHRYFTVFLLMIATKNTKIGVIMLLSCLKYFYNLIFSIRFIFT
jgi:hypothetical protein